ncbi:MAG TPA: SUMF1/EgtB/PvdO family nonheme iron enzyme [Candidatus Omnitrophota bacterium]|nr:SUMF1/EgtB/PvdO family nonheme iron enzyme [Candidatus Omnitrophota bacterium]
MKKNKKTNYAVLTGTILLLGNFFFPVFSYANGLKIENGTVVEENTSSGTATIQFDITWNNSWKDNVNFDAVWVFAKYSTDGGVTWEHVTLKESGIDPSGTSAGTGTDVEIFVPSDKKGCFIQRVSNLTGTVSVDSVKIVWDYLTDGVSSDELKNVGIKLFGVEMVYIPEGAFYAGDSTSTAGFTQGSGDTDPWYVESEKAISVENTGSNGYYYVTAGNAQENATGSEFVLPVSYAKGYSAIYVMKNEITEGQWVGFFNSLTTAQKTNRDITGTSGKNSDAIVNRNTISWTSEEATTTRPDRACGYLSWADLCAYADWAALRPMTELEFEKICRGEDISAVSGELAWGNTIITAATNISGEENGTEVLSNAEANCCYGSQTFSGGDGGSGPLRAGIFATSSSTRQQAGAGYYGALEFSGNLWERCVTLGNATGRAFLSTNGDGSLESTSGFEGNATNSDWPGYQAGQGVSGATGSGFKGGSWLETTTNFNAVSNRSKAANINANRTSDSGGRCVRSAQ